MPTSGGVLHVEAGMSGEVALRGARFRCDGCRRRVREVLGSARGVVSIDDAGAEALAVGYDPAQLGATEIAEMAKRALEADPSNPAPVTLTYRAPPESQDAPPARREPASTPIVETHAGMR